MNFLAYTIVHFLKQENNSTDESKSRLHITDMKKKQTGAWDVAENCKIYGAMKTVSFSLQSMKQFIS